MARTYINYSGSLYFLNYEIERKEVFLYMEMSVQYFRIDPNDNKNIFEDKGYYYVGILSGKFLDDNVDMNRTSFDISENKDDEEVSMEDIVLAAKSEVEKYLAEVKNKTVLHA